MTRTMCTGGSSPSSIENLYARQAALQEQASDLRKEAIAIHKDTIESYREVIQDQISWTEKCNKELKGINLLAAKALAGSQEINECAIETKQQAIRITQRLDKLISDLIEDKKKSKSSKRRHSGRKSSSKKEKKILLKEDLWAQFRSLVQRFFKIFFS